MAGEILLLEDDYFLRDGMTELLTREGYQVTCARNCREAEQLLSRMQPDLMILDVMLPDGTGVDLCQKIRGRGCDTPILFLSACDEEYQIVRGLDAGGDDYVTKPFKMQEFLSRVRALLRRRQRPRDLTLDPGSQTLWKQGREVALTPTEFQILSVLRSAGGAIVPRGTLLQKIWDCDGNFIDDNTLSVHVSRLREKIGPEHIATVRGTGYRWEDSN